MKITSAQLRRLIKEEIEQVEKTKETADNLFRSTLGNIKECESALDKLIGWIDTADYSSDVEPRLSEEEWQAAQEVALIAANIVKQVQFLKRIPDGQVVNHDSSI